MFSFSLQLHKEQPILYGQSHPPTTTLPPQPPKHKKSTAKQFHSQQWRCFKQPEIMTAQKQLIFLDSVKMCLVTNIFTHNSPHLVQSLYHEKLYLQESPLV
jgi:hypothetical protein